MANAIDAAGAVPSAIAAPAQQESVQTEAQAEAAMEEELAKLRAELA